MFRLALAGKGIAQFNEFIVADALKDGQLVRVLADCHHGETLTQDAIFAKERYRLPRVAADAHISNGDVCGNALARGAITCCPTESPAAMFRRGHDLTMSGENSH